MYKQVTKGKYTFSIGTFKAAAKRVSKVYHTGIHFSEGDEYKSWFFVIHRLRFIISKRKPQLATCNGG